MDCQSKGVSRSHTNIEDGGESHRVTVYDAIKKYLVAMSDAKMQINVYIFVRL